VKGQYSHEHDCGQNGPLHVFSSAYPSLSSSDHTVAI
jgi:hypothetical protein